MAPTCLSSVLFVLVSFGIFFSETESLKCYKCLALDCPGDELFCETVRNYIVATLRPYYDYGTSGYIGPCPEPDLIVDWKSSEFETLPCTRVSLNGRDEATCSLGRVQVVTTKAGDPSSITTHATIMGCMTLKLLTFQKPYSDKQVCSMLADNSTEGSYAHRIELENCPKVTDFCNAFNFCVPPKESVVKSFRSKSKDSSFEIGIVIAIVAVIVIIFIVLILASVWKRPLRRTVNYSPTQAQGSMKITSIEDH